MIFKHPTMVGNSSSLPKYRADIDGLRAIAVLAVVGFHAFPSAVTGGFVGVDIFFVISGFLISTIIFEKLDRNSFSFIEFYSRRVRRIFPALITILAASLIIGWLALFADEYKQLSKHVVGGAGFISNFLFWLESGYFDTAADTKPLLHLWSLGIEEQFYIFWPLMLWCLWKWRSYLLQAIAVIALISLALNLVTTEHNSVAAFYSPLTRFWELLLGSILAYRTLQLNAGATSSPTSRKRGYHLLSLVGLFMITAGFLLITKKSGFPGWWALLPTGGTALIIIAGSDGWLNRTILSNRLLVGIGLISYPLYLWHWPLLSFTRIIQSDTPAIYTRTGAVLISILLALATYIFIEKPMRFGTRLRIKTIALVSCMLVVCLLGLSIYLNNGLPSRMVTHINLSKKSGRDGGAQGNLIAQCGIAAEKDKQLFAVCQQDPRQIPRLALLGDSKGEVLYRGLIRTSKEGSRWLFIGGNGPNGSPVPVLSKSSIYRRYQKLTTIAVNALIDNEQVETVALITATRILFRLKTDHSIEDLPASTHYDAALEGLVNTAEKLIKAGKNIIIIVDNPTLPDPKDCLDRKTSSSFINSILLRKSNEKCHVTIEHHLELSKKYRDLLFEVKSRYPDNIEIFDTISYLCDTETGECRSHKNGRLLYRYTDHVSDYAAGLIGEGLNTFLQEKGW